MTTDAVALWFGIGHVDGLILRSLSCMWQVSCSDNSRRRHDYRCGEGGMEMKIEETTDVLRQKKRNVQQKCPLVPLETLKHARRLCFM